jgi:hypothetical protein
MRSFRGGSVRSWLSRIAINAAMDQQRLKKRRPSQPYPELDDESWQPPAGPQDDPVRTAMHGERSRVLAAALAAITPDQRYAIVLFDVEGYDYAEIADLTGVSLGTVSRGSTAGASRSATASGLDVAVPRGRRLMPHLPDHVTHDPELIAAYAAGDAAGPALDQAADLVASCTECAELHRDLRAISTALPELPAAVRRRDFRLTPEQAAALRPAGWRGVLAAFAAPRFRLAAPLGAGLTAAGLAGLLLASPGGLLPRATGEAEPGSAPSAAAGAPAVQADQAPGAAGAAATMSDGYAGGAALAAPEAPSPAAASAPAPAAGGAHPDASHAPSRISDA